MKQASCFRNDATSEPHALEPLPGTQHRFRLDVGLIAQSH